MWRVAILAAIMMAPAEAVIVDRIAATVGIKVITNSEIDLRIRLTAFHNGEKPELNLAARRLAAERLIDQKLVELEMDVGHYPRLPADRGQALLDDYVTSNYKGDREAFGRALAVYQLAAQDVEDDLMKQTDLLTFLNLRFRPGVQVTDDDVRKYFNEKVLPSLAKAQQTSLNEMHTQIEQQLTDERADRELDLWLQDQRKRTKIDYAEKDLAPQPATEATKK
jgi:peptidyl-prolyl cis-trans isomerase SurA